MSPGKRHHPAKPRRPPRKRFPSHERERMIVEQAIHFFAREGFSATTRDLAEHLGVTQSLIYQYFATKDQLIDPYIGS
ncbi:MAG: TetR/AcrR family transcriptional regulator [Alphaproteobacteria bacterium]|nr:TetR/AcrR family transcriptional regulator [Alphaproteobacteria bacterium]